MGHGNICINPLKVGKKLNMHTELFRIICNEITRVGSSQISKTTKVKPHYVRKTSVLFSFETTIYIQHIKFPTPLNLTT